MTNPPSILLPEDLLTTSIESYCSDRKRKFDHLDCSRPRLRFRVGTIEPSIWRNERQQEQHKQACNKFLPISVYTYKGQAVSMRTVSPSPNRAPIAVVIGADDTSEDKSSSIFNLRTPRSPDTASSIDSPPPLVRETFMESFLEDPTDWPEDVFLPDI